MGMIRELIGKLVPPGLPLRRLVPLSSLPRGASFTYDGRRFKVGGPAGGGLMLLWDSNGHQVTLSRSLEVEIECDPQPHGPQARERVQVGTLKKGAKFWFRHDAYKVDSHGFGNVSCTRLSTGGACGFVADVEVEIDVADRPEPAQPSLDTRTLHFVPAFNILPPEDQPPPEPEDQQEPDEPEPEEPEPDEPEDDGEEGEQEPDEQELGESDKPEPEPQQGPDDEQHAPARDEQACQQGEGVEVVGARDLVLVEWVDFAGCLCSRTIEDPNGHCIASERVMSTDDFERAIQRTAAKYGRAPVIVRRRWPPF